MRFFFPSRTAPLFLLLLAAGFLVGCGVSDPKSPKFVIAKGKDVKVTRADLDRAEAQFFQQRGISKTQLPADQLLQLDREAARQLVLQAVLARESARTIKAAGLEEKVKSEVEGIKAQLGGDKALDERLKGMGTTRAKLKEDLLKQLRVREFLRVSVPPSPDPSPADVQKFYAENKAKFTRPLTVRVSHVLIAVPEGSAPAVKAQKKGLAEAARARVVAPKGAQDFAKVATEVSQDVASARRGGDLGFFGPGQMLPQFEKVAFATAVGAVSPVFETHFGYHFLKVHERRPAGSVSFDEARPQIAAFLKQAKDSENLKAFLAKLEANAKVVYRLPPPALDLPKPLSSAR
ncbi:MAG: peptidylprolyl isomerase [Verrucomicrobiae bacterium]|nr:peptidylprolyl isomerase [Verrucomicrobiae bacterium]